MKNAFENIILFFRNDRWFTYELNKLTVRETIIGLLPFILVSFILWTAEKMVKLYPAFFPQNVFSAQNALFGSPFLILGYMMYLALVPGMFWIGAKLFKKPIDVKLFVKVGMYVYVIYSILYGLLFVLAQIDAIKEWVFILPLKYILDFVFLFILLNIMQVNIEPNRIKAFVMLIAGLILYSLISTVIAAIAGIFIIGIAQAMHLNVDLSGFQWMNKKA